MTINCSNGICCINYYVTRVSRISYLRIACWRYGMVSVHTVPRYSTVCMLMYSTYCTVGWWLMTVWWLLTDDWLNEWMNSVIVVGGGWCFGAKFCRCENFREPFKPFLTKIVNTVKSIIGTTRRNNLKLQTTRRDGRTHATQCNNLFFSSWYQSIEESIHQ